MKLDRIGLECVENKFLKLPNIQKYEVVHRTEDGFIASVEMDDGYEDIIPHRRHFSLWYIMTLSEMVHTNYLLEKDLVDLIEFH